MNQVSYEATSGQLEHARVTLDVPPDSTPLDTLHKARQIVLTFLGMGERELVDLCLDKMRELHSRDKEKLIMIMEQTEIATFKDIPTTIKGMTQDKLADLWEMLQ